MKTNNNLFGIGLRNTHFPYLESGAGINVDFFEILTENYINTRGRPFEVMIKLREKFPMAMHGVSLSIASYEDLNFTYLQKLKTLIEIVSPIIVSDHLCYTGQTQKNLHNLLPFTYNVENLNAISDKINRVQDFLKRQFVFENLSAYFTFKNSTFSEAQFLNEICERTGSGILLDINNLHVNSVNQNFSHDDFLKEINFKHVKQFHLAGYTDFGDYLFDTHSEYVHHEVWDLYKKIISDHQGIPTLIEWDENIPEFQILEAECLKAKTIFHEMNR